MILSLCSHERIILRSVFLLLSLLALGSLLSGFSSIKINQNKNELTNSRSIDISANADCTVLFRHQYNTLQIGKSVPIGTSDEILFSLKFISTVLDKVDLHSHPSQTFAEYLPKETTEKKQESTVAETAQITESPTAATTVVATTEASEKTNPPITEAAEISEFSAEIVETTQNPYSISASSVKTVSKKSAPESLYLDNNGVPLSYSDVIVGNASAYANDNRTSTGTIPIPGSIAVNPNKIPYGTKMWIVSADGAYVYGYAVAEDTGSFIHWSNAPIADLYFSTESECIDFGRRDIVIYIL